MAREKDNPTSWSWILRFFSSDSLWASSIDSSIPDHKKYENATLHSKKIFEEEFSGDLLGKIVSYLLVVEVGNLMLANQGLLQQLQSSGVLERREKEELLREFRRLITIESEDNQNKAEAILCHYPHLASELITSIGPIKDATGRAFETPMSAYGYAYWSGDTFMRYMMEHHMNDEAKAQALEECERITAVGVTFTLKVQNGEQGTIKRITGSRHFDFQPLIQAYEALINNVQQDEYPILWLHVGKEWAKSPLHVAQELCSDRPFHPLPNFGEENTNRTAGFYNWLTRRDEFIFTASGAHPGLGNDFSLYRGDAGSGAHADNHEQTHMISFDLAAIIALEQVRIGTDLEQTLNDLNGVKLEATLR